MLWLEAFYAGFVNLFGGGNATVWLIFLLAIVLWAFIVERYWYFYLLHPQTEVNTLRRWRYGVRNPLQGRRSRRRVLREMTVKTRRFIVLLRDLILVILLLGLLGSVTGLIRVLDTMAFLGPNDTTALARGISAAAIPSAAALAVVITGVYFVHALRIRAAREMRLFGDRLRHD